MSSGAEQEPPRFHRVRETLEEQIRRKGARPIKSVDELRYDGMFESDEELDEFLEYLDQQRQAARQRLA